MHRPSVPSILLTASLAAMPMAGCGHAPQPAAATNTHAPATTAGSPSDVLRRLHALHRQAAYSKIAELIVPDQRETESDWLLAIDEVLASNTALQDSVAECYRGGMPRYWNLAAIANNLGPFSRRIRILREHITGTTATVTLQEADNVPLVHAHLERVDGQWRYRPETPSTRMPTELRRLARLLRELAESVRKGAPFESIDDAFIFRVRPQLARIEQTIEPTTVAANR
ncbi:MAG: hypothetical protein ACE5F9_07455 [Phycisphaerae bacterium]